MISRLGIGLAFIASGLLFILRPTLFRSHRTFEFFPSVELVVKRVTGSMFVLLGVIFIYLALAGY